MITVNGETARLEENRRLSDFLQEHNYDQQRIVVGLNGTVVPKARYAAVLLQDGDALEVLHLVGGG
jgi:thiamine biosynthesis protein ThiS